MVVAADPVKFGRTPEGPVLIGEWPRVAAIAHDFVTVARSHGHVAFLWPYLTIHLANAGATYRVETCEQGVWRGELVESWRQ